MRHSSDICEGKKCSCGADARHIVREMIFCDYPVQRRSAFSAFLCRDCFNKLFPNAKGFNFEAPQPLPTFNKKGTRILELIKEFFRVEDICSRPGAYSVEFALEEWFRKHGHDYSFGDYNEYGVPVGKGPDTELLKVVETLCSWDFGLASEKSGPIRMFMRFEKGRPPVYAAYAAKFKKEF